MPGHVLVISKRHVCKIGDLNEDERKELIEFVVLLQEKILSTVADGCDIVQNYRPFLKADNYHKVDHLHVHLRPRHIDDVFQTQIRPQYLKAFEDLKEDEFNTFKKLIFE
jgi:diadenosine tetraphosphate (Ap4A) HIT family hydrolase